MGRSQRAMRDQAHYREDRLGDKHFPGNGAAAQGAVINPALKPGSRIGYIYDWANTWPSGSESGQPPTANDSATFSGLTLTSAGLPANAGTLTATGVVGSDTQAVVLMYQDGAAGQIIGGGLSVFTQGDALSNVAIVLSDMLDDLDNVLSSPSGSVANFNLQSAGTIDRIRIYMSSAAGGAVVPPLKPGEVGGVYNSDNGINYWLSRSSGQGTIWYYWIDVDNTPGPDTKRNLEEFLADDMIDRAYREDVAAQAISIGWKP